MDNRFLNKLSSLFLNLSILTFIIAFNFSDHSSGGWQQQFLPDMNNRPLVDITFTDSLTGYAIMSTHTPDTSFAIKTIDGGDNWYTILIEYRKYNCFQFLNNSTGFIGGGDLQFGLSYLIKTNNGGENWIRMNTPNSSSISGISVLNEDSIWVTVESGFDGGIFRTTNGGTNWTRQTSPGSNTEKIYMYNNNIGFASSSLRLYKTTNSGLNWDMISGQNGFNDIFLLTA